MNLGRDGVEIESGVFMTKTEFIPYSQIKYVEHMQSPLQKIMSFATISIDYGGWKPETIDLISQEGAEHLQSQLSRQTA